MQYAQKQLKIRPKNAINLTKIVHIAQMSTDRIRILLGFSIPFSIVQVEY